METLDAYMIRRHPDDFTEVECTFCGEIAARWNGAVGNDTSCALCDEKHESIYAQQGGQ